MCWWRIEGEDGSLGTIGKFFGGGAEFYVSKPLVGSPSSGKMGTLPLICQYTVFIFTVKE